MFARTSGYTLICVVGVVSLCGSSADGDELTFVAATLHTMYRATDSGEVESFEFPDDYTYRGMHRDISTGEVLAFLSPNVSVPDTVYKMENAFSGTPSLTYYASLSNFYGSVTRIGDTYYAFSVGDLYAINLDDPANPVETYVGDTGVPSTQGAAYDPVADLLYVYSTADDQAYMVDPATAEAEPIGEGFGVNLGPLGTEWYGGRFFMAAHNLETEAFEIGEIDDAGAYTSLFPLDSGLLRRAAALTVIPEPTAAALILAGALIGIRRQA